MYTGHDREPCKNGWRHRCRVTAFHIYSVLYTRICQISDVYRARRVTVLAAPLLPASTCTAAAAAASSARAVAVRCSGRRQPLLKTTTACPSHRVKGRDEILVAKRLTPGHTDKHPRSQPACPQRDDTHPFCFFLFSFKVTFFFSLLLIVYVPCLRSDTVILDTLIVRTYLLTTANYHHQVQET